MAAKRKLDINQDEYYHEVPAKKHTLDSDEEDSDDYEKDNINESDIEGGEEGEANIQDEVKITPFNMREELEEGHFDKEGHYHWNKDADIKDNWLDNIDWVKIKTGSNCLDSNKTNILNDLPEPFNIANAYAEVLQFMKPNETVEMTVKRLGKNRSNISSVERLRRKKFGIIDEAAEIITKFTEITNEILTKTGNMDIYQESYENIKSILNSCPSTSKGVQSASAIQNDSFDMYSDDFEEKEKNGLKLAQKFEKILKPGTLPENKLHWEFKWKQEDSQLYGPYTTEQMLKWTQENYFNKGVYVRKVGESSNFYNSNRIDFDLY